MKKHLPFITIEAIPHKAQVYETCGNYQEIEGGTLIEVSKLSDWRYEALIAVHELIEYIIIKHQGIKLKDIDSFDISFEEERIRGNTDEPGDDPDCPYKFAHKIATSVERILAKVLKVNWVKYTLEINSL